MQIISGKSSVAISIASSKAIRGYKNNNRITLYNKNSENLSGEEFNAKGINGIEWFWNFKIGFTSLNPAINRFIYYKLLPSNERVLCQWHDAKNNTIWFGTENRGDMAHLYKYNAGTGKLVKIKFPIKEINAPRFIIPLLNNTCMVATGDISHVYRNYSVCGKLFLLNTATNTLTYISKSISNNNQLTTDSLMYRNAYPDKAGNYWITTEGQGLICYDIKTQQFLHNSLNQPFLYNKNRRVFKTRLNQ